MTSISLPLQSAVLVEHQISDSFDSSIRSSPPRRHHSTRHSPMPNPSFSFPAKEPEETSKQNPAVSDLSTRQDRRASLPLPAFSFNPGDESSPMSSSAPRPSPASRFPRHRRQHSSVINLERPLSANIGANNDSNNGQSDNNTTIDPISATTSTGDADPLQETKNVPPPELPSRNPNRNIKGHVHQPSTAVDVTVLAKEMKVKENHARAPSAPLYTNLEPSPAAVLPIQSPEHPSLHDNATVSECEPRQELRLPVDSTDAPDSPATAKPSVATQDAGNKFPSVIRRRSSSPDIRPRTADASLMVNRKEKDGRMVAPGSSRPVSASGHRHPLRVSSADLLSVNNASDGNYSRPSTPGGRSDISRSDMSSRSGHLPGKPDSKSKKRQNRVRSWFISRSKSLRGHSGHTRADSTSTIKATPENTAGVASMETPSTDGVDSTTTPTPEITRTDSDAGSGLDEIFGGDEDGDGVVILGSPGEPETEDANYGSSLPTVSSFETSWKPPSFYIQTFQNESPSDREGGVLDLTAAAAPWEAPASGSGFSIARERMYSGGRRGEFVGPEMRYHRRTESAPEISPNRSGYRGSRVGGISSTIDPDVLVEEEEEETFSPSGGQTSKPATQKPSSGLDTNVPNVDNAERSDNKSVTTNDTSSTVTRKPVDTDQNTQHEEPGNRQASEASSLVNGLTNGGNNNSDEAENGPSKTFENLSVSQEQKRNTLPPKILGPSTPEVSPSFVPVATRKGSSPDLIRNVSELSLPGTTFPQTSTSSLPNSAYDTPRTVATPSSDRPSFVNMSSNDVVIGSHASVEDVPSMTSTASTKTNPKHRRSPSIFHHLRVDSNMPAVRLRHHGSQHSLTSKRSSIASFLVGHRPEKSKLSYEERPPGDGPEKTDKKEKKNRRVSRLMQFWKTTKDKGKSSENLTRV